MHKPRLCRRTSHCDETIRVREDVTIVESPLQFEDGLRIQIEPIPSSHAKGSLMLTLGGVTSRESPDTRNIASCGAANRDEPDVQKKSDIAFLGDSTYPTVGHGKSDSYNVQLLYQQIQFLRGCSAQQFYMSHRRFSPREKESILQVLESYYALRLPNKNVIEVSR